MPTSTGFCKKCGAPLSEGSEFCTKCGTPAGQIVTATPRVPGHSGRALGAGLVVLWIGIFLYLLQSGLIPLQGWPAYFAAGLGAALAIWGLTRYLSRSFAHMARPSEARTPRKEKPTQRFSGQLGIEHSALVGKKILFEFDPSAPYQNAIRDFALECVSNKETIIILTPTSSVIHQTLENDRGVKVINLTHDTMLSPILDGHPDRPLNLVYDSLTDLALSTDTRTTYGFAVNSIRQLSDPQITAILMLNPSAHEPKDVSSLRGLFSNLITYGKEGMTPVKFTQLT